MSSSQDILNLIDGYTNLKTYFENYRNVLDNEKEKLSLKTVSFYVDQVNGSDNNDGSEANPLASINAAIAKSTIGIRTIIHLLTDYVVDNHIYIFPGYTEIKGKHNTTDNTRTKLTFKANPPPNTDVLPEIQLLIDNFNLKKANDYDSPRFLNFMPGDHYLNFTHIDFYFDTAAVVHNLNHPVVFFSRFNSTVDFGYCSIEDIENSSFYLTNAYGILRVLTGGLSSSTRIEDIVSYNWQTGTTENYYRVSGLILDGIRSEI